jgi:N-methylhydantoinase A/oxoprolinase/acetone carboxylase beta subunit
LAAAYWGELAGFKAVLGFDMGGTTAKAILSRGGGQFPITTEAEVARVHRFKRGSGLPLLVPVLDMIEIGAGGGSIAHLNQLGLPAVGPQSAGSTPGPAAYNLGGTEPTVTDADLILGYLNPDYFLGGEMQLSLEQAKAAIEPLAQTLDMPVARLAWGIHQLVNENMASAARVHAAERGLDIRAYCLVATGGAGPVHACGVARRLGIRQVVVPPAAGVGSAFGLLLAPISFDFARGYVTRLTDLDLDRLQTLLTEMEAEGRRIVVAAGVAEAEVQITRTADIRYAGQGHDIQVPLPDIAFDAHFADQLQATFEAEYRRVYGRLCAGVPVQAVHWRVNVAGPSQRGAAVQPQQQRPVTTSVTTSTLRQAIFEADTTSVVTPVYNRYGLAVGVTFAGPLIIEETESTTVVPPGWQVQVDAVENLVINWREDDAASQN